MSWPVPWSTNELFWYSCKPPLPKTPPVLDLRYSNLITLSAVTADDMAEAFLDLMDQYRITKFVLICTNEFSVTAPVKNDTASVCGSLQRTASLRYRDFKDRLLVVLVDSSSNLNQTEKTIANIRKFGATGKPPYFSYVTIYKTCGLILQQ